MQLIINTYGSYLKKKEGCFLVKTDDKEFEVSARKVSSILITTSAYLSTDSIKLAMERNIDVIFLDEFGNPYGRVWHSKLGSTALIRRRQLEIAESEQGLKMAVDWVATKLDNQIDFIKQLANPRDDKKEQLASYVQRIEDGKKKLGDLLGTIDERRGTIMGLEGTAGRTYFEALNFIMPDHYKFEGRSSQPAKDEFNCMLNYGYGVLYSMVEKACIIAGLDPYVGFVHTDNYNKKSLVFDLIEMFRILVEKTVVYLFSGRQVKQEFFDQVKGGLMLNKEGKAALIGALNETFEKSVRYRGRNIKNRDIIQFECHRIANSLIKKEETDVSVGDIRYSGDTETEQNSQSL